MTVDWNLLAAMDVVQAQEALLAAADAAMLGRSGDEEDAALDGLEEPVRTLWLISWLDFEVSQGSLLAYFFNSHGRHAALAAAALELVGAFRMAEVLRAANLVYSRGEPEWRQSRDELDAHGQFAVTTPYRELPDAPALASLTEAYWQAAQSDDWGTKLDDYVLKEIQRSATLRDRPNV